MKKILATALTGTLLLTATGAAMAQPYRGHATVRYDRGYHHSNTGAAIGLGIGLFALGAILASSQNRYDDRYDYRYAPPPPPPPAYRYRDGYYYGR
jgi:opacity protein-like surface antigen